MLLRFLLFLPLALLAGCASSVDPVATLAPGVVVDLPPPARTTPLHREQLLTAIVNGGAHSLQTLLEAENDRITLAGLSPVGARFFKIVYTADGIEVEQLTPLAGVPPANQVLADIMLSYWPVSDWQKQLPAGWTLRDDTAALRTLRNPKNEIVEEIFYLNQNGTREPVRIRHRIFGYEIQLTNLEDI